MILEIVILSSNHTGSNKRGYSTSFPANITTNETPTCIELYVSKYAEKYVNYNSLYTGRLLSFACKDRGT